MMLPLAPPINIPCCSVRTAMHSEEGLRRVMSWTHHGCAQLSLHHTVFMPECHRGRSFIPCKWADRNIV